MTAPSLPDGVASPMWAVSVASAAPVLIAPTATDPAVREIGRYVLPLDAVPRERVEPLVDFAINRERAGLEPREAIRQACLLRFRPIVMTTMTALLSGVALMLGQGAGSELRQPLGYAMVGGLALSQALTR